MASWNIKPRFCLGGPQNLHINKHDRRLKRCFLCFLNEHRPAMYSQGDRILALSSLSSSKSQHVLLKACPADAMQKLWLFCPWYAKHGSSRVEQTATAQSKVNKKMLVDFCRLVEIISSVLLVLSAVFLSHDVHCLNLKLKTFLRQCFYTLAFHSASKNS